MCKPAIMPEKGYAPPVAATASRRPRHLLRYASCRDLATFGVAMLVTVISGANQPAQLIIFGNLLDSFNDDNKAKAVPRRADLSPPCYLGSWTVRGRVAAAPRLPRGSSVDGPPRRRGGRAVAELGRRSASCTSSR